MTLTLPGTGLDVSIDGELLAKALTSLKPAVASRGGALPVLSGVRLEHTGRDLVATTSDLELTIRRTFHDVPGTAGVSVVPFKILSDVTNAKDGRVTLRGEADEIHVEQRMRTTLRALPADEFPRLAQAGDGTTLQIPADAFLSVLPAASGDDARPILTGIYVVNHEGQLRIVATDSYRLHIVDLDMDVPQFTDGDDPGCFLVPSRAIKVIVDEVARQRRKATKKIEGFEPTIDIVLGEREMHARVGDVEVTSRLIEGEFPNYKGLVPVSHPNVLTFERADLVDGVKRVKVMARELNTPVRLVQVRDSETAELIAITQDVGRAHMDVPARYDGVDLTVAFNPAYFLEVLEVAKLVGVVDDEVTLHSIDAQKPAVVKFESICPDGTSLVHTRLLMPVRVS